MKHAHFIDDKHIKACEAWTLTQLVIEDELHYILNVKF